MKKAILSWSGGKDAALALETINHEQTYEVVALLTTIEAENGRTISHGVHKDLILAQGNTLGLPVDFVPMPIHATNQVYEKRMTNTLLKYQTKGIETVIFGDLFLEDLRAYRENQLASIGMNAYFPLWRQSETQLINYFLNKNYRALTVCVDGTVLSKSYVGKEVDAQFFSSLPPHINACGENGEFHTFVYDSPLFSQALNVKAGPIQTNVDNRYIFCDLMLRD